MKTKFFRLKSLFAIIVLQVALPLRGLAADKFVMFQSAADAWQLKEQTVSFTDGEHSCVKLAIANLEADFEKVTGTAAQRSEGKTSIVIGTVGTNPQINQWVKQGLLSHLKGKTEKYIIKTIDGQLVIAGSDKRGTVYGIYELSRQMGVSPWHFWADCSSTTRRPV